LSEHHDEHGEPVVIRRTQGRATWLAHDRTLNIGHRGASAHAPENTLAAFRKAAELGADGVELDVQRCRTGEVVVVHDEDLSRVAGLKRRVRDLSLAQLKELEVGAWFDEEFRGERIPTLDEVFGAIPELLVNVELKLGPREDPRPLCAAVAEIVRRQAPGRVLVSSFHPAALFLYRRLDPQTPLGYLHHIQQPLPLRLALPALALRPFAMHPDKHLMDHRYLARARQIASAVHVWTVDDPHELAFVLNAGVDGVITNYPDRVRRLLNY
jgi:glycerophosphoryl diester phosphodiesterase